LTDLFEVQDDITRSIVASTQTQVVLNEGLIAERHEHPDFRTWDMAKRGWREIYQLTRESLERAREIGLGIKQHDPLSPKGPQIVATATYHLAYMGFASDPAAMREEAIAEAREAIRRDDRDEYTQWTYGNVLTGLLGRHEEAIAAYQQALEINPNFSLAYGTLGTTLAWAGRFDESIARVEMAIRLNPRDPSIFFRYTTLAVAYFFKQDYPKAREWAQHAVARRTNWWIAWVVLAASHAHLNDFAAAKAALSGLQEVLPNQRISTLPFPPFGEQQVVLLRDGLRMAGLPE
jgi:adenylate cyclase